ncbi:MAG: response regulator [Bacteroidetes bacterium]|nr:response regulator [Bacteroidota bacterium]
MSKTILLIEDNKEVRENTAEILELANYKVRTTPNGKEGIRQVQIQKPDLIICDIMMPELDGYAVLRILGKNPDTSSIPFVFLTAKSEKSDFRKGMTMGADDYLTKPFDDTELLNVIETRLKKSEILKIEFTKTIEGLSEFIGHAKGMDELKKVSAECKPKKYLKRESIYIEGNHPKGVFFINKGKVKTYKSNADAKEYVTGLYKEGDFFGYTSLLEDTTYADSAMALESTEVVLIPKEDFFALLFHNRDVATKFIKILSDSVAEKEERLIKLAYNSVRKRLAEALMTFSERYKNENEIFSMAIPREDLASMIGTATETVTRTLTDFKEENLVDIKNSTIAIIDPEKLSKMKN